MNSNINKEANGNPYTDLKKMFSSHVLENVTLSREKSGLDHAKVKKIQELNHKENVFLRKYAKYIEPNSTPPRRRGSIDASVLRNIDSRASLSRPTSQGKNNVNITFGRESVNNECPYSYGTWSKLVNNETNLIEEQKNEILYGSDTKIVANTTQGTISDDSGHDRLLRRRGSLKPLLKSEETETEQEFHTIQKVRAKGRRHSVTIGALPMPTKNQHFDVKLPKINESINPIRERRASLSQPDLVSCTEKIKPCISNTPVKMKHRTGRRFSAADIKHVSFLNHTPLSTVNDNNTTFDKPVANAVVVVREDINSDKELSNNNNVIKQDVVDLSDIKVPREVQVLPSIPQSPDGSEKSSLTDNNESKPMSLLSVTNVISPIFSPSTTPSPFSRRRRNSFSKAALELLIDTHHGASKLRYIAKLAHAMEKEEKDKLIDTSKEDTFAGIMNCRYLRGVHKLETEDREAG